MPKFGSISILVLLISFTAHAARVVLTQDAAPRASVKTELVATDSELASVKVSLSIPSLDIEKAADGFDTIRVQGLAPVGKAGRPDLFTTGSLIAIPQGFEAKLNVQRMDQRVLPNVLVAPNQPKFRCPCDEADRFHFDGALYDSNELFPRQVVSLETVGNLRGLRLARVAFHPIQMDMARQSLKVTTDIEVQVHFQKTTPTAQVLKFPKTFYQLVQQGTANGKALGPYLGRRKAAEVMLVFVADELKDAISPLVEWEQQKGLNVVVQSLTEAGGNKEAIRDYIQKYYDEEDVKPSYLLFIGNGDTMPPFMESTSGGNTATDYPFSLLTGEDIVPDVLYGRIVANDVAELNAQMSRWINYEKTPKNGADWYAKGLTIASNEGFNPSDKEYAERVAKSLTDHTYTSIDQLLQGEKTATAENIIKGLDEGRSWVAFFGHGTGEAWGSTNGTFNVETVEGLTNTEGRLPVIIDVACTNASYVKYDKPFGKAWVVQQHEDKNAGAVAFYGGSVVISWHPPAIMSEGIAKYHFEKPVHTLGGSVLAGQLYLIEKKGTGSQVKDNITWYNLFGDPSMLIRTATPKAYTLKHEVQSVEGGVALKVQALDNAGKGVEGLRIALNAKERAGDARSHSPLAVGETNADGNALLTLPEVGQLEPDSIVTVSGYNAESKQIVLP